MKKLIYNEITKDIDIVEQEETQILKESELEDDNKKSVNNIKDKTKKLNRIKDFLKIFSSVLLSIMSIVISVVGVQINNKTKVIYEKQLEILENDREPYFTIKSEKFLGVPYEGLNNYDIEYEIKNEGGLMLNPRILRLVKYITIYFNKSGDKYKFNIDNFLAFSEPYYNNENSTIRCFEYRSDEYDNFVNELMEEIKVHFESVSVSENNYIDICYVNYKNKQHFCSFEFTENEIKISNNEKEGIYIGSNWERDIKLIIEEIKKGIKKYKRNN